MANARDVQITKVIGEDVSIDIEDALEVCIRISVGEGHLFSNSKSNGNAEQLVFRDARERKTQKSSEFALPAVALNTIKNRLISAVDSIVDEYSASLRKSLAVGDDPAFKDMLERAMLREHFLASTSMADNAQACRIIGLSAANASASMSSDSR